jgi:protein phosphatase PTC7
MAAPGQPGQPLGRSPTFLVGAAQQRVNLDEFKKNDQHLSETYRKNVPLCFSAKAYQRTHPRKAEKIGHRDADVTLTSPVILGVADGVSQIEDFGIDASELPRELMQQCEELAMDQVLPCADGPDLAQGGYMGPVTLMREAYENTEALGSTTACVAILDNSTQIHGKLHPMIAVLAVGDCELLILRRLQGRHSSLQAVFHTEMQRIGGHAQQPIQIARVDDRIDPNFDENIAIEVIERGSAAHYVSAYEGDILVLGSDGVFDNLYLDEVQAICNEVLRPSHHAGGKFVPCDPNLLYAAARRIVEACHMKTQPSATGQYPDTPIGKGGKVDDTCCVVGETIQWTNSHSEAWSSVRRTKQWQRILTCGSVFGACSKDDYEEAEEFQYHGQAREYPYGVNSSFHEYAASPECAGYPEAYNETEHDKCCIM